MGKLKDRKTSTAGAPSCDWGARGPKPSASDKGRGPAQRVRLHRFDDVSYKWSGIRPEAYKQPDGSWSDVVRHTIIGARGESTDFHLRYFEIAPGGNTSLERHEHEHVVVGLRGSGLCRVRSRYYEVGFMDVLYIPPGAGHQLENPGAEPFGFFCMVDAERDRPVLLDKEKGRAR